jgi:hypothetical protein
MLIVGGENSRGKLPNVVVVSTGESLDATKSKSSGDGPWIMPLEADDTFFDRRITYVYRENSLYNRLFEQRKRLASDSPFYVTLCSSRRSAMNSSDEN